MYNIYTIYKTTNLINNKFYVGKHKASSDNPNDDYLGSGSALNAAIKKYGRENFKKEVLHIFKTEEEAYDKEAELVTEDVINDPLCYNQMLGGKGSISGKNHPMSGYIHSQDAKNKISSTHKGKIISQKTKDKMSKIKKGIPKSKETRLKMSNSHKGKKLSAETKRKLSKPQIKITCPHCNKTGGISAMKQSHFDNCKLLHTSMILT